MIIWDHEVKGSELIREFLISQGEPIARLQRRRLFTPYAHRIRLMQENADKPEGYRKRSLRNRLTKLDKALTDQEAYALDRAFSAWLALNGKSKSVDFMSVGGGSGQSEPLNDTELKEANAFRIMKGLAGAQARFAMSKLFEAMAPWNDEVYKIEISDCVKLAKSIKNAYEQK